VAEVRVVEDRHVIVLLGELALGILLVYIMFRD
jgi:hypothetical protein